MASSTTSLEALGPSLSNDEDQERKMLGPNSSYLSDISSLVQDDIHAPNFSQFTCGIGGGINDRPMMEDTLPIELDQMSSTQIGQPHVPRLGEFLDYHNNPTRFLLTIQFKVLRIGLH